MRLSAVLLAMGILLAATSAGAATGLLSGKRIAKGSIPLDRLSKSAQTLVRAHAKDGADGKSIVGAPGRNGVSPPNDPDPNDPEIQDPEIQEAPIPGPAGRDGVTTTNTVFQAPQVDAVSDCRGNQTSDGLRFSFGGQTLGFVCDGLPAPPSTAPTDYQVRIGVFAWCQEHALTDASCKSDEVGPTGSQGNPGPGPTTEQIADAVTNYCSGDRCKGSDGANGFTTSVPTLVSTTGSVSITELSDVSVTCPGDGVPVGGGGKIVSGTAFKWGGSAPTTHGWAVSLASTNGSIIDVSVSALCVSGVSQ
jgi:hypothetical protein